MLDTKALYEAVENERWARHLTRVQLAQELGMSRAAVNLWARGGGMSADAALRVSKWLGRDLRDFGRE